MQFESQNNSIKKVSVLSMTKDLIAAKNWVDPCSTNCTVSLGLINVESQTPRATLARVRPLDLVPRTGVIKSVT